MIAEGSEGIRRRLDRVDTGRQDIDAAIKVWRNDNPDPWTAHSNPDKTEHHFHIEFNVAPDLIDWGLMFGEAIHNLRATLDNVVWLIASRDMYPTIPTRRTQFPIFLDEDAFFGRGRGKGGLAQIDSVKDTSARAIIQQVQPWQRRDRPDLDPLWGVHEFDREVKHQVITPVLMLPHRLQTNFTARYADAHTAARARPPLFTVEEGPLEHGTKFLTVYTPTPPEEVQMQYTVMLGVGVTLGGDTFGIISTLGELCKYVRGVVEELLDCLV